jgi:hypothetical protein
MQQIYGRYDGAIRVRRGRSWETQQSCPGSALGPSSFMSMGAGATACSTAGEEFLWLAQFVSDTSLPSPHKTPGYSLSDLSFCWKGCPGVR